MADIVERGGRQIHEAGLSQADLHLARVLEASNHLRHLELAAREGYLPHQTLVGENIPQPIVQVNQ